MKKKRKTNRNTSLARTPVAKATAKRRPSVAAIMATVGLVGAVVGFGWWKSTHSETKLSAPVTQAASTTHPTAAIESNSEFQKLKGKWVRPDGGYVFEIRSVEDGGKIVASYSNPRPINVSKAEASRNGVATKVFFELRDVNYPGSTYDLTYNPQADQLQGFYYQAALQQQFEVYFVRMD
jgi:hypothetical protein